MSIVFQAPPPPRPSTSQQSNGYSSSHVNGRKASIAYRSPFGHGDTEENDVDDAMDEYDSEGEDGVAEVSRRKVIVHIEARLQPGTTIHVWRLRQLIQSYIPQPVIHLRIDAEVPNWREVTMLGDNLDRLWVAESVPAMEFVETNDPTQYELDYRIHIYASSVNTRIEEFAADLDDDDDDDQIAAASVRDLPSHELDGLWENLVYSGDLKGRLLNYIYSTIAFSEAEIDFNVVTWNRMVLLHGPPGTGKTSLCRALAQKLAIRLSDRYTEGRIVEINSHSLFSKWFSESGKLVQRLFSKVQDMVDVETTFVVVMIDEVESLTAARAAASSGNEPSDAIRVVNALLTQLDKLKARKNVLVMTTSNISGSIDSAFIDRADIKEYVGFPPAEAIYWILTSCLEELMTKSLIRKCRLMPWRDIGVEQSVEGLDLSPAEIRSAQVSARIANLAKTCEKHEMAGRLLRRIPVLAHARYLAASIGPGDTRPRSVERWLKAMEQVVEDERKSRDIVEAGPGKRG
ncbi:P-loop containing nucleoside triphosphate hydrolase protein [Naematelia encephala]|uniref:p-loop containing nucleoside triphosphate hydrolase protein n=1 Tax=Naematelia encephala TaxID=71784 RepID=A0A1Y2BHJ7_9TREE|nr:P-loop containing nucleoside triphosphate hydrolase protein [Naematelia encephala]